MQNSFPYISFTFDDFPRSALRTGGTILRQFGLRGTYYASLGLMGTEGPTGQIFVLDDIKYLLAQGHELGCHTFSHCHSWDTAPGVFEDAIIKNKEALNEIMTGSVFRSFSYPMIGPHPRTKSRTAKYYNCCRGGGQKSNNGKIDLNFLKAYFLEKTRDHPFLAKKIIDFNTQSKGWLIFATHDISASPTPFGCTPSFFEDIVRYSVASGAKILPVAVALDEIMYGKN